MDPELREYLEALSGEMVARFEQVEDRFTAEVRTLRGDMAGIGIEMRTLGTGMAQMEQRLIENIQGRREDIDAAFVDIDSLRRAVRDLDKRVKTLETR